MTLYEVVISDIAMEVIRKQAKFIAVDCQASDTASRWLKRVLQATEKVASQPRRFAPAPEDRYRSYEIRALVVSPLVLLFTIDDEEKRVVIIGARHGKSLPRPEDLPED